MTARPALGTLDVTQLAEDLWQVPVPLPSAALGSTNVYVLLSTDGPVLVDAGWHGDEAMSALERGLATVGTGTAEVAGVLVTHNHPDHLGLASTIRDRSGAWVAMHEVDAATVAGHLDAEVRRKLWGAESAALLRLAGAPDDELVQLVTLEEALAVPAPARPDRILRDDEPLGIAGFDLVAIWTPGHSPGHVCFVDTARGHLFAGDHVLQGISPHVGLYDLTGDGDPLGAYLTSLHRLPTSAIRRVFPGHGPEYADLAARVDQLVDHHEQRLDEIARAVADGADTLWAIATTITWGQRLEDLDALVRRIALGEANAHVRHLERRGRVVILPGSDGSLRVAAAAT